MKFTLENIDKAAEEFLKELGDRKIVAFYGSMGAGKTTFIKAICDVLGVTDTVNSPTFAIVNEYLAASGDSVYHFDFYRIKKIEEAYDFGYEDYFYSGDLCLIEWPELIEELLPEDTVRVKIEEIETGERVLTLNG
ncbi:MAG: tRNA (adenosine(37)-N6)-threonylcarbamoyltransferase complex ATPase subunit type 1 TsaE [Paludibacteraceae bacterium]|nr:tRNA (adenosine(37)-N6)-threonylcarbamoyltransferase complex ATPase subunit type 1 TsaE [Paludibacteraceae bacterium]